MPTHQTISIRYHYNTLNNYVNKTNWIYVVHSIWLGGVIVRMLYLRLDSCRWTQISAMPLSRNHLRQAVHKHKPRSPSIIKGTGHTALMFYGW